MKYDGKVVAVAKESNNCVAARQFGIDKKLVRDWKKKKDNDALSKTADSDSVSTYQVFSVHLVTDKKLEAFDKA